MSFLTSFSKSLFGASASPGDQDDVSSTNPLTPDPTTKAIDGIAKEVLSSAEASNSQASASNDRSWTPTWIKKTGQFFGDIFNYVDPLSDLGKGIDLCPYGLPPEEKATTAPEKELESPAREDNDSGIEEEPSKPSETPEKLAPSEEFIPTVEKDSLSSLEPSDQKAINTPKSSFIPEWVTNTLKNTKQAIASTGQAIASYADPFPEGIEINFGYSVPEEDNKQEDSDSVESASEEDFPSPEINSSSLESVKVAEEVNSVVVGNGGVLSSLFNGVKNAFTTTTNALTSAANVIYQPLAAATKIIAKTEVVQLGKLEAGSLAANIGLWVASQVVENGYGNLLVQAAEYCLAPEDAEQQTAAAIKQLDKILRNRDIKKYLSNNPTVERHLSGLLANLPRSSAQEGDESDVLAFLDTDEGVDIAKEYITLVSGEKTANRLFPNQTNELSTLLSTLRPKIELQITKYIGENGTDEQKLLWRDNKKKVSDLLDWTLHSAAVNLFKHMEENIDPAVSARAARLGLSASGELLFYIYHSVDTELRAAESAIASDIAGGTLVMSEDPERKIVRLNPYFKKVSKKLANMAFGEKENLSVLRKFFVGLAEGTFSQNISTKFEQGQRTSGDNLEDLDPEAAIENLSDALGDHQSAEFLGSVAAFFGELISNQTEQTALKTLKKHPEIRNFLKGNSDWKIFLKNATCTVILRSLLKRIEERSAVTGVELTPADTIESLMNIFGNQFGSSIQERYDNAQNMDEKDREKETREIFEETAKELYSLIGSKIPIPFPSLTRVDFEKILLKEVLPDALASCYKEWNSHQETYETAKNALESVRAHNHATETARVLAKYVTGFIPSVLAEKNQNLAQIILVEVRDILKNARLSTYIKKNQSYAIKAIIAHLESINTSGKKIKKADTRDYIQCGGDETNLYKLEKIAQGLRIVENRLRAEGKEDLLNSFLPSAIEIDNYITSNHDHLKAIFAKNIDVIAHGDGIKAVMQNNVAPWVEAATAKVLANTYLKLQEVSDPIKTPDFLTKLILQMLNTAADFHTEISKVRIQNKASAASKISFREMVKGFGDELHKGVPATEEAINATEELKVEKTKESNALKNLASAKKEFLRTQKNLTHATQNSNNVRAKASAERANDKAKSVLDNCRSELASIRQAIKSLDAQIDPIREENMKKVVQEVLKFVDITKPGDLPVPPKLQKKLWPLVTNNLLPKLGVELLKKFMNPHTQNLMVKAVLDIIQKNQGGKDLDKIVYIPPKDATQAALDEALGRFVKNFLSGLPKGATYAVLQLNGINNMTAGALGSLVRQNFGESEALLDLFEQALESGTSNLVDGTWKTDADNKPVYEEATSGQGIDFPMDEDARENAAIKLDKEQDELAQVIRKQMAKTISGQMQELGRNKLEFLGESILKFLIRFLGGQVNDVKPKPGEEAIHRTFRGLWVDLQNVLDELIEKRLGAFGKNTKKMADSLCRLVIATIIGSILKPLFGKINEAVWWVFEEIVQRKAKDFTNYLSMDIREQLYLSMFDEILKTFNRSAEVDVGLVAQETIQKAETWEKQEKEIQDLLEQEASNSRVNRALAVVKALKETMDKEPTNIGKIKSLVHEIGGRMSNSRLLVINAGIPVTKLSSSSEALTRGFEILSEDFEALRVKGDGHCLFRAFAYQMLEITKKGGEEQKNKFVNTLKELKISDAEVVLIENILSQLFADPAKSVGEIINTKSQSDLLVKTLRTVACEYNKSKSAEVLEGEANDQKLTVDEYVKQMSSMQNKIPKMGGEPEVNALANAFQIKVTVYNAEQIGLAKEELPESDMRETSALRGVTTYNEQSDVELPEISLLFYSEHYNILRKLEKEADGEPVDPIDDEEANTFATTTEVTFATATNLATPTATEKRMTSLSRTPKKLPRTSSRLLH